MNLLIHLLYFILIFNHSVQSCFAKKNGQDPIVVKDIDIEYSQGLDNTDKMVPLLLDVYQQPKSGSVNRPVVMLVHGGGWVAGDKGYTSSQGNFYPDIAMAFANRGFVAFSINYRLNMSDYLGAAVDDVFHALKWIKGHQETYGIDTSKVLIAGDSAGGAIVVNASYRNPGSHSFAGCIDMWGGLPPYKSNNSVPVNNCPISTSTPPTCIIHGTEDRLVLYSVSQNLSNSLTKAGVYNELHPLEGAGHYPKDLAEQIIPILINFAQKVILTSEPHSSLIDTKGKTCTNHLKPVLTIHRKHGLGGNDNLQVFNT